MRAATTILAVLAGLIWSGGSPLRGAEPFPSATASSSIAGYEPAGAVDGQRFAATTGAAWKGRPGASPWWWQARFAAPQRIGAILQIVGDHEVVLRNAPRRYVWQASDDDVRWEDLTETATSDERRMFRLHRLNPPRRIRFLRLRIEAAAGEYPTLREVECFAGSAPRVLFPDWAVIVDTTGNARLPGEGLDFLRLAREGEGWSALQAQQVWLGDFDEALLAAEPRPLCAFLSGNFKDWCQQERARWRGVAQVLRNRNTPMWASCGGAQGLAILAEHGVEQPWDCPHCRDPQQPRTPIYTHIGHTDRRPCGDYSACLFERGPHNIRVTARDPVFAGLPDEFSLMESHCGQIEWPPAGWRLIATAGQGTRTKTQCLRMKDRYIYAAQFHVEMPGTPENSRRIMSNFLRLAKAWGGYNPAGRNVRPPEPVH